MTSLSIVGPTTPTPSPDARAAPPAAKLAPPPLPRATLARPRLGSTLSRAVRRTPLTLISGPAGSGKTTLAASWCFDEAHRRPVAWLSVDTYDDEPTVFWGALVEALAGAGVPRDDLPPQPDGGELPPWFVPELAARLAVLERPVVLVVDDADRLSMPPVVDGLDLLVRTAGTGLRLVLCARADPPLPLHRYRLAGTITEIRGDRLAFTPVEARALLAALAVDVSAETAAALCAETRGWAVGLRLAARPLALAAPPDRPATALAQDDGDIARYLAAEVLERQPATVRRFLLRVSVTSELWPDLVARLSGRGDGGRVLGALAHANAFVEAAPGAPGGYRIHPLFREMLEGELAFEHPDDVVGLHRVAAHWYADAGRGTQALEHALAADDLELVARLLLDELAAPRWLARGTDATWRRVDRPLAGSPGSDAAVLRAAAAVAEGREPNPGDLATTAAARGAGGRAVLRASAALTCVTSAAHRGDHAAVVADAATADPLISELPVEGQREATAVLRVDVALGALRTDDPAEQLRTGLRSAAATAREAGAGAVRGPALADLAVLEAVDGNLTRAVRLAVESDELAVTIGGTDAALPAAAATATGWAHLQRYSLARATDWVTRARRRDPGETGPSAPVLAVLRSRLHRLRHEHDDAWAVLDPWRGDHALPGWAREHVLGEAVLIAAARGGAAEALALLDAAEGAPWAQRLRVRLSLLTGEPGPTEPADGPTGGLVAHVETLVLQASRLLAKGREAAAAEALVVALATARPELLRLPFLEAPPQARRALRTVPRLGAAAVWLNPAAPLPPRRTEARQDASAGAAMAAEELSGRETEVLRHLAELLSTEEIAATMFVSVNTVRTHIRSILRKLGVTRRNDAVRRARELELL